MKLLFKASFRSFLKSSSFLLVLMQCTFALAQNNLNSIFSVPTEPKKDAIDTAYIKDISDKMIIKFNRDSKIDFYTIKTPSIPTVSILPNNLQNYSFGLDYKFIGLTIALPKSWHESSYQNYLKGKTTGVNINLSLFFNKWMQTINYNVIKGYYIPQSELLVPNWQEGVTPYYQLPNFKTQKIGGSTSYIFNASKFSYRSFSQQTQIQKKSAGSFIPTLSYEYSQLTDEVAGFSEPSYKKNLSFTAYVGYQYNWVIGKKLLFSGGIFPGIGRGFVKSSDPNNPPQINYLENKLALNFNANLNYQWKKFFFGIQFSSLNSYITEDESKINNTINYENIYLGYQFDAPKAIQKSVNWLEKKLF